MINLLICKHNGNTAEYGLALYQLTADSRNLPGYTTGYGAYLLSRWYYDLIRETRE